MDSGNFTMGPDMDAEEAVIQVDIINRPDVTGAVLQTPSLDIDWFLRTFETLLHQNRETKRAEILREFSFPTQYQMSGVKCQVSGVWGPVSRVMYIW